MDGQHDGPGPGPGLHLLRRNILVLILIFVTHAKTAKKGRDHVDVRALSCCFLQVRIALVSLLVQHCCNCFQELTQTTTTMGMKAKVKLNQTKKVYVKQKHEEETVRLQKK